MATQPQFEEDNKKLENTLIERDLYDDHGPVILGERKQRPLFTESDDSNQEHSQ